MANRAYHIAQHGGAGICRSLNFGTELMRLRELAVTRLFFGVRRKLVTHIDRNWMTNGAPEST